MAIPLLIAAATAMTALAADRRTLSLYHGAQRFDGPPTIMAHRKGHAEHGPGIYLTTSWDTARKYSKGGGAVYRFELDANLGWLEDKSVAVANAVAFLKSLPRMKKRDDIIASITRLARGEPTVRLTYLVNALVNADQSSGQHGPAIAAWLVEQGVDVSHVHQSNEDWVVLFNPRKVITWSKISSKEVGPGFEFDLPGVKQQQLKIDPIFVWCHLCHAACGEPCRFGLARGTKYHDRRIYLAGEIEKKIAKSPESWVNEPPGGVNIEHALAMGSTCREDASGICLICGQTTARLKAIPGLLK